ncbi:MAG: type II toxin-antitoxin system prevent-host-death family antitoxin [Candidatus Competibacteraceae bacterium]
MSAIDVFTVRDLRQRSGELLRHAEAGTLAVITEHGRPALLAIPFDRHLLEHGVHRALALHLLRAGQESLVQAAKLADMALEDFLDLMSAAGIVAVDYPPEDLEQEIKIALS